MARGAEAHRRKLVLLATGVQGSAATGGSASGCKGAEAWRERKHCSRHLHPALPGRLAPSPVQLTTSVLWTVKAGCIERPGCAAG